MVKGNSPTVAIVGDKLWFQGSSTINITQSNPRGLPIADTRKVGAILTH